ncbi:beta-galactosidase, partial [Salinisphaera sp.]|uniref:beta-galactosidase n=1 Tax=Salinisphaera sp. TaxID=1914330 RepID=UPI002D76EE1F
PEHWPERQWAADAEAMTAIGIKRVRIAEFAWRLIEPEPGEFDWGWLDRAVETLAEAGLEIVMCTPTATPPRWLVRAHPEILAVGADGRTRGFGSRRHYCFSSPIYRAESRRITAAVAKRYGGHPSVVAWQTDNEYGCHDTVVSYSPAAAAAFRDWLAARYGDIATLNAAWGTVFWSQIYDSFDDIDPPVATVTEPNPAQVVDFSRFSSDQVVAFNREQVTILRAESPGRTVLHNSMGLFTDYDHHVLGRDLDAFSWDSYPLGFLDVGPWDAATKQRYMRTGHPDVAAFHHDLYRGAGRGRFWVMEQQPGPVNWAQHNAAPLPGMVRLWTWEAFAHGAETVSYFRWRQAPFAQEQWHTGLQRPDGSADLASGEARQVAEEIAHFDATAPQPTAVALVFDYPTCWMLDAQPQGANFDYWQLAFAFYTALRRLGLDIDIVAADADLSDYALVVVPSLAHVSEAALAALNACPGRIVFGPRSGSKTRDFQTPENLAPGALAQHLGVRILRAESLRPGHTEPVHGHGYAGNIERWLEHVDSDIAPEATLADGRGVVYAHHNRRYLAGWPDPALCQSLLAHVAAEARLAVRYLPAGLRLRQHGGHTFAFNFGPDTVAAPAPRDARLVIGERRLAPAGLCAWVTSAREKESTTQPPITNRRSTISSPRERGEDR